MQLSLEEAVQDVCDDFHKKHYSSISKRIERYDFQGHGIDGICMVVADQHAMVRLYAREEESLEATMGNLTKLSTRLLRLADHGYDISKAKVDERDGFVNCMVELPVEDQTSLKRLVRVLVGTKQHKKRYTHDAFAYLPVPENRYDFLVKALDKYANQDRLHGPAPEPSEYTAQRSTYTSIIVGEFLRNFKQHGTKTQ